MAYLFNSLFSYLLLIKVKAIKPAPIDKYNTKALDNESLSHEGTEVSFNSYEVKIVLNWVKINTSVFLIISNSFFHLVLLVVHALCNRNNKVTM